MRVVSRSGYATKTINRQKVLLNLADTEQRYMYRDCIREPENTIIYIAMARHGLADKFIDIGANCGHVALSIIDSYPVVLLYEPNPSLVALLGEIFHDNKNVHVREKAVVGSSTISAVKLFVPFNSSGLATIVGTHLNNSSKSQEYSVPATTLEAEFNECSLNNSFIKIDVEGQELDIISSSKELLMNTRPIVGFEALSLELLQKCAAIFENCNFYCSRFDFLEPGGSLVKSPFGIMKALARGANIEILQLKPDSLTSLSNFSQVYAVPREKSVDFESAVREICSQYSPLDLSSMHSLLGLANSKKPRT